MSNSARGQEQWDLVVGSSAPLFELHLKDVWRYRDLVVLFVRRDFVARYKQTILGPLWHVVQPLLTTLMFLMIFGRIANLPTDGIQPILFYMSGITIWNYFASCLTQTSNTFVANANIFGKVYFPRLVIPLSVVISNILSFGIQFLLLLTFMAWYHFNGYPLHFGPAWLLIPLLILLMAGLGLGAGIIVSSLTTKYRDFAILVSFAVQLLMYATPVAYPLSYLKGSTLGLAVESNPLSPLVEAFRFALFGTGNFSAGSLLYSVLFVAVALFLGLVIFSKVERAFIDTV